MVSPRRPTHDATKLVLRHLHLLDDGSLTLLVLLTLVVESLEFGLESLEILQVVLVPGVTRWSVYAPGRSQPGSDVLMIWRRWSLWWLRMLGVSTLSLPQSSASTNANRLLTDRHRDAKRSSS